MLVREELADVSQRSVGHYTHEKNPLAAAAGLATLEVIEQGKLLAASESLGRQMREQLHQLASRQPMIHEVRGVGLAVAVEIAIDGAGSSDAAERIMFECLRRGLSFKVSAGRVLTLTPPLTITAEQLGEALAILKQSIDAVARQLRSETPQSPLREIDSIA